jgi:Fe-S-cluster containining protein
MVTADLELKSGDWKIKTKVTVPSGPVRLRQMLPMLQTLGNALADAAARESEKQGEPVSCKKGCGACCRQLVPIPEVEARRIRELVESMPEPRRSEIRGRFAEALRRLDQGGLLEKLRSRMAWTAGQGQKMGMEYFGLRVPCPFLEEESCSIHADRPLACREYMVSSPPEHCANPTTENLRPVRVPLKLWTAVARMDPVEEGSPYIRWVPLTLSLEFAEAHPEEPEPLPGPELVCRLVENMTGKKVDSPQRLPTGDDPFTPPARAVPGA